MLEEREIFTDTRSITFLFKLRTVTPTKYIFEYQCRYVNTVEYYEDREIIISENCTYFSVVNLHPGSQCEINVLTVYHPGCLDSGLSFIVNTYLSR